MSTALSAILVHYMNTSYYRNGYIAKKKGEYSLASILSQLVEII